MSNNHTGFDVIGDIHGHASALENLLKKMGYTNRDGVWRHPERLAVFIGDYVDRGHENIRTCRIVMDMQEAGAALAIMGNHEFNHLAYDTPDPKKQGEHLRKHSKKNNKQAEQTIREFEKSPDDKRPILDWMKTLPLWLDLPGLRVVHAFWSPKTQAILKPYLAADNSVIWENFPELAKTKDDHSEIGDARSHLLSGLEHPLPDGISFTDSDKHTRREARLKWWKFDQLPLSLHELVYVPPEALAEIPDELISKSKLPEAQPDTDARPVIFGHYWMKPKPDDLFLGPRHVCVDASIAKGGKMAAYRFSGESELSPDNLVFSSK